jgi:hypothetical protein
MTTLELKHNFHQLIDSIENENLLEKFYELMLRKKSSRDGVLWSKLSKEEIDELLASNEEVENPENQISHEEMKNKYSEWI